MRPLRRLVEWLLGKLLPAEEPDDVTPVEWHQRHARPTVGDLLDRVERERATILPPRSRRGK